MGLLEKLRANKVVDAQILENSKYLDNGDRFPTRIPLLNLALSGSFKDGGMPKNGIIQIAAPPKHFKTNFMLELIKAFQDKNAGKDHITVLYDSELGSTPAYYKKAGIDTSRIDHRPIKSVEQLRSDITNLLNDAERGDNVFICIDSIGMLRSDKETKDAMDEHGAADMTRAKVLNSLFRIITAESAIKQIPILVINHAYQTMEMFPKEVASGGRKTQYAAHTLLFITKAQEKEKDELAGFTFTLKAGLSRYVREKSDFPITVTFDKGIYKYSGIYDLAVELGFITPSDKKGFVYIDKEKQNSVRASKLEEDDEFLKAFLENQEFIDAVEKKYRL
jgi:RecA/RadA recombinase